MFFTNSMDHTKDIFELNSKCSVGFNAVLQFGNEKKKVARRRWAILAKALKSPTESQPSSPTDEISVRRISSFMLLKTQELSAIPATSPEDLYIDLLKKRTWYKYSVRIDDDKEYFVNVGHRNRTFSAEDLMGFNNTGNVCIWPSEETLSYFVCSNLYKFNNKSVIELGGGMSCLAGLFVAKYGNARNVTVTDGNKISVENVQATIKCNCFDVAVKCKILKWCGDEADEKFDVILCADCLFFDDARADLIECLWACLDDDGVAYVMAPQRGSTLDSFIAQSEAKGFLCRKILNYSNVVWEKRLTLLDNCDYDDNIHYPILIVVTKADYWKSQAKKYCDFCKCWIADNKPSVEFHEKGRRHQENVKKKLKTISRNSAKTQREMDKVDSTLKRMEAAAMAAYRKDVEGNASADLTSIAITNRMKDENLTLKEGTTKVWYEAKSKEGHVYYWNTLTNETVWEPPKDGYLSMEQQKVEELEETAKQMKEVEKLKRLDGLRLMAHQKAEDEEERARLAREKMKERRVQEDIPEPVYGPLLEPGRYDPYGKWEVVKEPQMVDLQLPVQPYEYPAVVAPDPEPPIKQFKEKTVESIAEFGECSKFKKRKILGGAKKNSRQRMDNE